MHLQDGSLNEIGRRLSPEPQSLVGHANLGRWFTETSRRFKERRKIRRDLDWKPLIPFEEGVALMMAEIQNWRDAPFPVVTGRQRSRMRWLASMPNGFAGSCAFGLDVSINARRLI
jgi:hypothetical protein